MPGKPAAPRAALAKPDARQAAPLQPMTSLDGLATSTLRSLRLQRLAELGERVKTGKLGEVPPRDRGKLIQQMADRFTKEWSHVDENYADPASTASALMQRLQADAADEFVVAKHHEGKLMSVARLTPRDDPPFNDTGPGGSDKYGNNWLADVYTEEHWRGIGLAAENIKTLQRHARDAGLKEMYLYTEPGHKVGYYAKLGFEKVGDEHAAPGEPVVIMRCKTGA